MDSTTSAAPDPKPIGGGEPSGAPEALDPVGRSQGEVASQAGIQIQFECTKQEGSPSIVLSKPKSPYLQETIATPSDVIPEGGPSTRQGNPSENISGLSNSDLQQQQYCDDTRPELNEEHARLLASLAAGHGIDLTSPVFADGVTATDAISELSGALIQQASQQMKMKVDDHGYDDERMASLDPEEVPNGTPQGPIQAYAKIDFPGFSIYLQTLQVTIGRRPAAFKEKVNSMRYTHAIDGSERRDGDRDVDIDLGDVKSISRRHAIIYYHAGPFYPQPYPTGAPPESAFLRGFGSYGPCWRESQQQLKDLFVIKILGKHGAMVDDVYIRQGGVVQLGKRTKIQIAERVFYFVLPPNVAGLGGAGSPMKELGTLSPSEDESEANEVANAASDKVGGSSDLCGRDDGGEGSPDSGAESAAGAKGKSSGKGCSKLVLKRKDASKSFAKDKGKDKSKGLRPDDVDIASLDNEEDTSASPSKHLKKAKTSKESKACKDKPLPAWAQGAGVASRKRKRGDPKSDEEEALKVGTPIGIEALEAEKRAKAAKKRLSKAHEIRSQAKDDSGKEKETARIEQTVKEAEVSVSEASKTAVASAANGSGNGKVKGTGKGHASKAILLSTEDDTAEPVPTRVISGATENAKATELLQTTVVTHHPRVTASAPPQLKSDPTIISDGSASDSATIGTMPLLQNRTQPRPPSGSFITSGPPQAGQSGMDQSKTIAEQPSQLPTNPPAIVSALRPVLPVSGPPSEVPAEKPNLSNVELIRAALSSAECVSGSGKLTLAEIFDWLQKRWKWFKDNGRNNDRDWQGALRQAVTSTKDFLKIPRKPTDKQSKGVFYTLIDSPVAVAHREELARLRAEAQARARASLEARALAEARGEFQPGTLMTQPPLSLGTSPSKSSPAPSSNQTATPVVLQTQVAQPSPDRQTAPTQSKLAPPAVTVAARPSPSTESSVSRPSSTILASASVNSGNAALPTSAVSRAFPAVSSSPSTVPAPVTAPSISVSATVATPSRTDLPATSVSPAVDLAPSKMAVSPSATIAIALPKAGPVSSGSPEPTSGPSPVVASRPPPMPLPLPPTPRPISAPVTAVRPSAMSMVLVSPAAASAPSPPPRQLSPIRSQTTVSPDPAPRPSSNSAPLCPVTTPAKAGSPSISRGTSKPQQLVPLVIGPPPPDAEVPKKANTAIQALLDAPPIVHHDGKLFLSSAVFGHLSQDELRQIERLGPQRALKNLQDLLVEYLKQKVRQQQLKGKTSPSPSPGLSSVAPRSRPTPENTTAGTSPPLRSVTPPAASGQAAASVGTPAATSHPDTSIQVRPRPIQPPASAQIRPNSQGSSTTTPRSPLVRPAGPSSQTLSQMTPAANAIRPLIPSTTAGTIRPPNLTTTPSSQQTTFRPPSGSVRPVAAQQQTNTGQGPPPVAGSSARPYRPSPMTSATGPSPSSPAQPSHGGAYSPPPPPCSGIMRIGASPPPPGSPLAALNSLSSHPEAAGLMAVLRQSGSEPGKLPQLTSGQIQLLQLANAIASQHQQHAAVANPSEGRARPGPTGQLAHPAQSPRPNATVGTMLSTRPAPNCPDIGSDPRPRSTVSSLSSSRPPSGTLPSPRPSMSVASSPRAAASGVASVRPVTVNLCSPRPLTGPVSSSRPPLNGMPAPRPSAGPAVRPAVAGSPLSDTASSRPAPPAVSPVRPAVSPAMPRQPVAGIKVASSVPSAVCPVPSATSPAVQATSGDTATVTVLTSTPPTVATSGPMVSLSPAVPAAGAGRIDASASSHLAQHSPLPIPLFPAALTATPVTRVASEVSAPGPTPPMPTPKQREGDAGGLDADSVAKAGDSAMLLWPAAAEGISMTSPTAVPATATMPGPTNEFVAQQPQAQQPR